jgi:hypothetical protein
MKGFTQQKLPPRLEERRSQAHEVGYTPYAARDHNIEALLRAQTTGQVFSGTAVGLTVFKMQGRDHTTQKSDLLFGAIQECDMYVRATDGQRYPGHTSTGTEIEHAYARQEKITL